MHKGKQKVEKLISQTSFQWRSLVLQNVAIFQKFSLWPSKAMMVNPSHCVEAEVQAVTETVATVTHRRDQKQTNRIQIQSTLAQECCTKPKIKDLEEQQIKSMEKAHFKFPENKILLNQTLPFIIYCLGPPDHHIIILPQIKISSNLLFLHIYTI